jgi:hypothetical protein
MTWNDLTLRVRALVRGSHAEEELEEELQFHLEMQSRQNQSVGKDAREARRLARAQFGNVAFVKEECRDMRGIRPIDDALADVRYAFRSFRRAPTFALTVVATIALALGLNTALFTIFNAYVFHPAAVHDPDKIYRYTWTNRGQGRVTRVPSHCAHRCGN